MAVNYLHPSYAGRTDERSEPVSDSSDSPYVRRVSLRALRTADRACCCSAKPAVMALMPASRHRPHQTDLLLCAHHYRAARNDLAAVGATVVDDAGHVLATTDAWPPMAGR
jgi:hypothetical protein